MKTLILLCILCYTTTKADKPWQLLNEENTTIIQKNSKIYFCLPAPKKATTYFDFQAPNEESFYIRKDSLDNSSKYVFKDWEYIALREGRSLRFTSADTDSIPTPENSFHPWDIRIYEVERKYSLDSSRTIFVQQHTYLLGTPATVIRCIYIASIVPFICYLCLVCCVHFIGTPLIRFLEKNEIVTNILAYACSILTLALIIAIPIAAITFKSFLIIIYPLCLFFIPAFIMYIIRFIIQCVDFGELWTDIKNYFKRK